MSGQGSGGNVLAALCSFFIPGLGQLLQGRLGMAIFMHFLGWVVWFGTAFLFGWVITVSTRYSQPALGILICIFAGWLWQRDSLLQELKKSDAGAEQRLFWKIWPLYVKWLCPVIAGVILAQSVL